MFLILIAHEVTRKMLIRLHEFNEDKLTHARPLLKNLNALSNVYQVNIFQILILM